MSWSSQEFELGTLLVDLCRMRGKGFRLRPLKEKSALSKDLLEVDAGVQRHYAVDAWWHNSKVFTQMIEQFKNAMKEEGFVLERASFLGHIGVEMLLDRQLMAENPSIEEKYYGLLDGQNKDLASAYLSLENKEWVKAFEKEWDAFRKRRFLRDYVDLEHFSQILAGVYSHVTKDQLDWVALKRVIEVLERRERSFLKDLF